MKKTLIWLDQHFEECIMLVLFALIVVIMATQVTMRYLFRSSLTWPEELSRYFFIWFVFLGISYGVQRDIHIKVDILETIWPPIGKVLKIIQDILFLAFCIYMIRPSVAGLSLLFRTGQTSAAMQIPMYMVYLSLLVGFLLSIFRMVEKYVKKLINRQSFEPEEGKA